MNTEIINKISMTCPFSTISTGQMFLDKKDNLCIRIGDLKDTLGNEYNAWNIKEQKGITYLYETEVIPVISCKIIIE